MKGYEVFEERGYRLKKEAALSLREYPETAFEVPCRKGRRWGKRRAHLYVHGKDWLGFSGIGNSLRRKLSALGCTLWQSGDEEFSVIFPVSLLDEVAVAVQPMFKRKSPSKREIGAVLDPRNDDRLGRGGGTVTGADPT